MEDTEPTPFILDSTGAPEPENVPFVEDKDDLTNLGYVKDFVTQSSVKAFLKSAFVFIHHKLCFSDLLLNVCKESLSRNFDLKYCTTKDIALTEILKTIKDSANEYSKQNIYLIDAMNDDDNFSSFIHEIARMKPRPAGIWIRTYLGNMPKSSIHLFDLHFLFNMSETELDVLRSVFPLEVNNLLGKFEDGNVILFLNGINDQELELKPNPILLKIVEPQYPFQIPPILFGSRQR